VLLDACLGVFLPDVRHVQHPRALKVVVKHLVAEFLSYVQLMSVP